MAHLARHNKEKTLTNHDHALKLDNEFLLINHVRTNQINNVSRCLVIPVTPLMLYAVAV